MSNMSMDSQDLVALVTGYLEDELDPTILQRFESHLLLAASETVGSAQFATSWLTGEQRDRERREHRDHGDGEKGGVSFGVSPGDTT
jgi:hypothetical protein